VGHFRKQNPFQDLEDPNDPDESRYSMPDEAVLSCIPEKERAQYLRSFNMGVSRGTKAMNVHVEMHL